ncbi:MAG TPA: QueG-associated DUF1730 domain-containing protein, partial [Thermoanaerobaculia bacterium]|nr:QueG-associated DUF1730 domain-containing protein [Thermoanaerobaculia bacterium]
MSEVWPAVERIAREHGVVRLGASNITDEHSALFEDWLDRGHHGTMHYLARTRDVRRDPHTRFPWAKSAIVILVPYASTRPDAPPSALSNFIARYALGDDYHATLDQILRQIEPVVAPYGKTWRYVDTGPLSDRALATQAGLGWIAKNA